MGWENVDWIVLRNDMEKWLDRVNTGLRCSAKGGKLPD
jgi:hypothetical protein